MKFDAIKKDIESCLGADLTFKEGTTSPNGIYEAVCGKDTYVFAVIGAFLQRDVQRKQAQMQDRLKPLVIKTYKDCKREQKKFEIL